MKVIIFGATGMVGQGVLLECLSDARVERALCVGRAAVSAQHEKIKQLQLSDVGDLSSVVCRQ